MYHGWDIYSLKGLMKLTAHTEEWYVWLSKKQKGIIIWFASSSRRGKAVIAG